MPPVRIIHMETTHVMRRTVRARPAQVAPVGIGQKGLGEGGAIALPAAITNAVNDALKGLGVELLVSPVTPRRVVEAIKKGRKV